MALYLKRRDPNSEDYVDNKLFTSAMTEYSVTAHPIFVRNKGKKSEDKEPLPPITPYIASCILKIAQGLARRPNFSSYTYKDELVSHAVENCVKVACAFNPAAFTRSGKPNAFAYFTQICYFAFLRVIKLEKAQEHIKLAIIDQADLDEFAETIDGDNAANGNASLESVKRRLDTFSRTQQQVKPAAKKPKKVGLEAF